MKMSAIWCRANRGALFGGLGRPRGTPRFEAAPSYLPAKLPTRASSIGSHAADADSTKVITLRVPSGTPGSPKENQRLDCFLAGAIKESSRARLQACIKGGSVEVNGAVRSKSGFRLRPGDSIVIALPPPPPLSATPETIPICIVFEDDDVLVVNKAAGMVTHPAPGNYSGTLVNAVLGHCNLPSKVLAPPTPDQPPELLPSLTRDSAAVAPDASGASDGLEDGDSDEDDDIAACDGVELREAEAGNIRPGIVHRLDKGTSGLLVVAKSEAALQSLAQQFKDRTVQRTYVSVALRSPSPAQGRVEANVGRDPNDRKRMAAFPYVVGGGRGRHAASNYKVVEALCGGRAAVVAWKLDTGRTHQIRVHAKHLGCPLLGDDTYGGGAGTASEVIGGSGAAARVAAAELVQGLGRPALHAATLGFTHPTTGENMSFSADVPEDMMAAISTLRSM